jgi:hypothetical protein
MDYSQLSVERLHELFSYQPGNKSKPLVRNIDVTYNAKKGDRPGVLDSKGYMTISIDGKNIVSIGWCISFSMATFQR